jgi:hypothetical protein
MQLFKLDFMVGHTESVAIEAYALIDLLDLLDLALMAGTLAACIIRGEFLVVNGNKASFYDLVGRVVAFEAIGFDQLFLAIGRFDKVARIAHIAVDLEMLVAFEAAVACAAGYLDSAYFMTDVFFVRELGATEFKRLGRQFVGLMAFRSQAGYVKNRAVGLGSHPSHDTIDRLGQAVDFALYVAHEARLEMAIQAINLAVRRFLPAIVVRVHDVAGVAKARLLRDYDHARGENNDNRNHDGYLGLEVQLHELAERK